MLGLIGADGKKTVKESERAQYEAISGDSIARNTGTVPQVFDRIQSVKFDGTGFEFKLKPNKYDLRDTMYESVYDTFKKLGSMRLMLRKAPLADPKMAAELLIELERKLIEACEDNENALKEINRAMNDIKMAEISQAKEDLANGIVRF